MDGYYRSPLITHDFCMPHQVTWCGSLTATDSYGTSSHWICILSGKLTICPPLRVCDGSALVVTSMDGYLTVLSFADSPLGDPLELAKVPPTVRTLHAAYYDTVSRLSPIIPDNSRPQNVSFRRGRRDEDLNPDDDDDDVAAAAVLVLDDDDDDDDGDLLSVQMAKEELEALEDEGMEAPVAMIADSETGMVQAPVSPEKPPQPLTVKRRR
jgi:hypothetical protein